MDLQEISALTPGGLAYPIEVRLLRKWTPFYNKNECHYIFVDKSGNAIEAISNKQDPSHRITSMDILSCYRLENYICQDVKTSMRSVSQSVTIKLGKAATITPILSEDIPTYYFEFLKYDLLQSRINNNAILTDYIGKIISISDTQTRSNISLLKMRVQDLSDNIVEIALWEEVANSFDKKAFWTLPHPVIAAFSSLKVSEYRGEVQLGSTTATCVYVNPDIEIVKTLSDRFKNTSTISTFANESIKTEVSQDDNKN